MLVDSHCHLDFDDFSEDFDGADAYTAAGWFFLVPPEASSIFDENMARLKGLSVRTWEVSVGEAAEELTGLNTEGIARVAFEPESGYADPHVVANGFVSKARQAGAEVHIHTRALGISRSNGRVSKVTTPKGDIETEIVVIAAGPWASEMGRWVGLDLPPPAVFGIKNRLFMTVF